MLIDLQRFVAAEKPAWEELESVLDRLERDPEGRMGVSEVQRFHQLYERACADLGRVSTFGSERNLREYLESLVARAYGEIHEVRARPGSPRLREWLLRAFPQTFRRHAAAFGLALALTLGGVLFGAGVMALDPGSKEILMPFPHLQQSPGERVREEERAGEDRLQGSKATFSSFLMTNNIRVSILALALGMSWGIGTAVLLFYNGAILGAVAADYVLDGQSVFLLGWLLPHGAIEIPAILIAGQGGLLLARALIGRGRSDSMGMRLREIGPDLMTLIGGVALLLVWAGLIEAFFSQYHEPVIPYAVKISFGVVELCLLAVYLGLCGRTPAPATPRGARVPEP